MRNKQTRFNKADAFIAFFAAMCLLLAVIRVVLPNMKKEETEEYKLYFSANDISHTSGKYFVNGDVVRLPNKGTIIGRIEEITSILPTSAYVRDKNGDFIKSNYPWETKVDVSGVIICMGNEKNGILHACGIMPISQGDSIFVNTEHLSVSIWVNKIEKIP